jgi:hypothetical protein
MVRLLIDAAAPQAAEAATRFGGLPLAAAGTAWPICRTCKLAMQFLGQLRIEDKLLLMFMCENDPGCCAQWDANDGGNSVLIAPLEGRSAMDVPADGNTQRQTTYGATLADLEGENYDDAREAWAKANGDKRRAILGQLFGEPGWIQDDETPNCDACQKKMRFVAQLEEGPDNATSMNFGSGAAYVFDCSCDSKTGKMLWQQ